MIGFMRFTYDFIDSMDEIKLTYEDGENVVYITREVGWDGICVELPEEIVKDFDSEKELLLSLAINFVNLDKMVNDYCTEKLNWNMDADVGFGVLDSADTVSFVYWENTVNNEFTVSFKYTNGQFVLDDFNGHSIME